MGKRIKRERSEIREKGILRDLSRGNSPTNALIGKSVKQPVTNLTKPAELTKLAPKLPKLLIAQIEQDLAKPKSYQLFTNPEVIKPLMDEIEKMGEKDREVFDAHGSMFGKKLYAIKGDWAAREEADLGMIDSFNRAKGIH